MGTALRILLSTALAGLLLAALALWGDVSPADLREALERLPPSVYLTALAIHVAVYNLRALRYRLLLSGAAPAGPPAGEPSAPTPRLPGHAPLLAVSAAHNLATYVLPARTGDASLVLYLRGLGVPMESGLAALVVSRLLDLAVLCLALGLACLTLRFGGGAEIPTWFASLGASTVVLGAAVLLVAWRADRLLELVRRPLAFVGLERSRLGARVLAFAARARDALRTAGRGPRLVAAALITGLVWLGLLSIYAVLARGFGLPRSIGFASAAFGAGMAVLANLLPINALAGLGTHEMGWVFGFHLLGVDRDLAFATGLGVHLAQILNVCLLGVLGHVAMGALRRGSSKSGGPA